MPATDSTRKSLPTAFARCLLAALALAVVLAWGLGLLLSEATHAAASSCTKGHEVLRVGSYNGKAGECKSIQEAVKAVEPGGWILIGPGDYKQSNIQKMEGAVGDDRAGADIVVTTPNIHIRGMNRNTVMIDGTKPGNPECSPAEAAQNFGTPEGSGFSGNNGIVVYKAPGVWLQNFSACNFLSGNLGGGDEIWFDGQQSSGKQEIGSWWGEYLSATSTYWEGTEKPSATYGVYASNTFGPGVFENAYASNMSDSGIYIGACPDCNTVINHSQFEGNDLGYSGSNSGGHLVIENTEFNNNEEGVATTSQNNDDAPSPQEGLCPGGKENPSAPSSAQRKNICWVMIHSRIIENNNGGTPTSDGAPGLLGTGMTDAGGHNDLVAENTFAGNKAWGILVLPYPGLEEEPPPQVLEAFPEDNCRGGTKVGVEGKTECLYEPFANEVEGNTFANNGGFKNLSNGDIGEVANPEPKQLINCWHGNLEEGGGEPSSEPKLIQTTHGTCSSPDIGGEPTASVLAGEAACDSRLVTECPGAPGEEYPRTDVKLLSLARMAERSPTMPNPCQGVPSNPWCPPALTKVEPHEGPMAGGTEVAITGANLAGAKEVKFGSAEAKSFHVSSPSSITAESPPGSPGTVDVTVTTAGGRSAASAADHYTYVAPPTVKKLSPNTGSDAGGTEVAITGTNFTGAKEVKFGSAEAKSFHVSSPSSITAESPPGSPGTVDVTVITVGGTSANSDADRFSYP